MLSPPPNIALIGLMGSGKTTVGRILAARTERQFVDTDAVIVQECGCDIPTLFAEHGEAAFREIEERVIEHCCGRNGQVIATGGGAILRPRNRAVLCATTTVIWLTARPDVVTERVRREAESRPLLQQGDLLTRLLTLLAERAPLYQEIAHLIVDTSDRPPQTIAAEIHRKTERILREKEMRETE